MTAQEPLVTIATPYDGRPPATPAAELRVDGRVLFHGSPGFVRGLALTLRADPAMAAYLRKRLG